MVMAPSWNKWKRVMPVHLHSPPNKERGVSLNNGVGQVQTCCHWLRTTLNPRKLRYHSQACAWLKAAFSSGVRRYCSISLSEMGSSPVTTKLLGPGSAARSFFLGFRRQGGSKGVRLLPHFRFSPARETFSTSALLSCRDAPAELSGW